MKILAIEGLDKSGKHSMATCLKQGLETRGYRVAASEFHRYDTPTGQLIQSYLKGEYEANNKTVELLMAADKHAQHHYFNQLEEEGYDVLILDRYTHSQLAYGLAKGEDRDWLEFLLEGLRKPDYVLFLDVTPQTSMARKGKHGENDRYESDFDFLTRVRGEYLSLLEEGSSPYQILNAEEIIEKVLHLGFLSTTNFLEER